MHKKTINYFHRIFKKVACRQLNSASNRKFLKLSYMEALLLAKQMKIFDVINAYCVLNKSKLL